MVIGGGAGGLVASIVAAREGNSVFLVERNSTCGKKIVLTGNGKCNYFNENQDISHYHSSHPEKIKTLLTEKRFKDVLSFFDTIGMVPKIKNGYYYPYAGQATSMKEALLVEAKRQKVTILEEVYIEKISKEEEGFLVCSKEETIKADAVILATGSKACPKTGSDGNGYALVSQLGHSICEPLPALVPLKTNARCVKEWAGIRCEASLSLFVEGKKKREEAGEIQLTPYGISGICTFNLSGIASRALYHNQEVCVSIDFLPFLPKVFEERMAWLEKRQIEVPGRTLEQFFEPLLQYKLIRILLKEAHLSLEKTWNTCLRGEKEKLVKLMSSFPVPITGTESYEKAQVCTGGIPLTEINLETMESLKVKDLYLVGEMLDVDGDCGGYNLTFAFLTGMIAGRSVGEKR